jgi:hypothetical protein
MMWNMFIVTMNVVFSIMAGVVFAVVVGSSWWFLMFCVGLVLWNVLIGAILLIIGFVISVETIEGGK